MWSSYFCWFYWVHPKSLCYYMDIIQPCCSTMVKNHKLKFKLSETRHLLPFMNLREISRTISNLQPCILNVHYHTNQSLWFNSVICWFMLLIPRVFSLRYISMLQLQFDLLLFRQFCNMLTSETWKLPMLGC